MNMTSAEYFFYEWLILEKKFTEEDLKKLTTEQFSNLQKEYALFLRT